MTELLEPDAIRALFSPETYYRQFGKIADQGAKSDLLVLNDRAIAAQTKRYGSPILGPDEHITLKALTTTWLMSDSLVALEFNSDNSDVFKMLIGNDEYHLPISRNGARWVIDAFAAGCKDGDAEINPQFDEGMHKYMSLVPLVDDGGMLIYAKEAPEKGAGPVIPDLVILYPPLPEANNREI